jgi:hypothetical protein
VREIFPPNKSPFQEFTILFTFDSRSGNSFSCVALAFYIAGACQPTFDA